MPAGSSARSAFAEAVRSEGWLLYRMGRRDEALRTLEQRGMISRAATTGRGIAVTPTERAAASLRTLRAAWSR